MILNDLKRARRLPESPGAAATITNVLGIPIEKGLTRVGSGVTAIVPSISPYVGKQFTNIAIERLFKIAQLDVVCFGLGRQDYGCNIAITLKTPQ